MEASIQHRIASLRRELADATRLEAELGQRTKNTVRKSDQAKATSDQETAMLMRRAMYDPSRGNIVSNQKSVIPARRSNLNWIEENKAAFPQEPAVSYLRTKSDEAPPLPRDEDDVYKVLSRAAKPPRKTKAVRPRPPKRNRGIARVQSATQLPKLVESLEAANNAQDRALEASIEAMQKSLEAQHLHTAPERRSENLFNTDDKVLENRRRPERQHLDCIRAPGIVLAPILDVMQRYIMRQALYQVRAYAKSVDSLETHFMLYPQAVLGLQARYRGRKDRLRVRKLEEKRAEQRMRASITIQSFWRQCRARLRIAKLRDELRVSAALRVQRVWRGARARRRAWVILRRRIWAIAQVWLSMGVQSSSHVVQSAGLSTQEHAALSQVAQVMVDSKERVPELSPHVLSGLLQGVRVAIFVRDTVAQREENLKDEAVRPAESAPERREKEAIRKREIAEQRRRESLRKAEERRKAAEAEQAFMERALREEREQTLQEQRRKAAVQEETSRKLAATRAEQEEKRRRKASEERAAQRAKEREIERRRMALADARRTLNAQCEEDVFALREVHLPSALRDLEFGIAQKRISLVAEQRKLKARRLAIQAQLKEPLVPSAAKAKLRDALATLTQEESTLASSLRGLDDEHKHGVLLLETSMDEREEEIRAQYAALRRDAENEFSLCVRDGKL